MALKATRKLSHQPAPARRCNGWQISAVTWAGVLPPRIHGASMETVALATLFALRARWTVSNQREVAHGRFDVQFTKDLVTPTAGGQTRDPTPRIIQVTEHDCLRRTRLLARGLN